MFAKLNNPSCAVAIYRERNYATDMHNRATTNATESATQDLLALSTRVLARNQRNQKSNYEATNGLRADITSATIQSIREKQDIYELKLLIAEYGFYYDAPQQDLIDQFNGSIEAYSMEVCLSSYENVIGELRKVYPSKYKQFINKRRLT